MAKERASFTPEAELVSDPDERARLEVANGFRQHDLALDIIWTHASDRERPFRLRSGLILQLHHAAMKGLHRFAGTYRNTPVDITDSKHKPPEHFLVPEEVERLCGYVNEHWADRSAIHLCAYVMWRLNWIHPFADGNGRTSRALANVVLNVHLGTLLPGKPSIPDQITRNKAPYYDALEAADTAYFRTGSVDTSDMEKLLTGMLARQLANATREAAGEPPLE